MARDRLLVVLNFAGAALCWWPLIIWQAPGRSHLWWLAYLFIALMAGIFTVVSGGRWLRFLCTSTAGTFAGSLSGFLIWPLKDGIAQSYVLFGVAIVTGFTAAASLVAGLLGRAVSMRSRVSD